MFDVGCIKVSALNIPVPIVLVQNILILKSPGYVFAPARISHLPENGETFEAEGYLFEVVTMDGHKIEKVHIVPIVKRDPSE